MESDFQTDKIVEVLTSAWQAVVEAVSAFFTVEALVQLGVLALLLASAHVFSGRIAKQAAATAERHPAFAKAEAYGRPLYRWFLALFLVLIAEVAGEGLSRDVYLLEDAAILITAWIIIRLAVNLIGNRSIARFVAGLVFAVAALNVVGWLEPLIAILQAASIQVGDNPISAYDVIWGVATFVITIWVAVVGSNLIEGRLQKISSITPSAQVLVGKIIKIALVTLAFLIALESTGIDLTALAVFSGALGVGLGFGLQKVVSNFISGVILLIDRSIKPGDVVEIQGTYGSINKLAARYTSVITRDGTEYLIPNEDMITQPVVNWSHSHPNVRRRIPVSVAYSTDIRRAMEIMDEAAESHPRVLKIPKPGTRLMGFGDNGVDLELRMWISDPQNGVVNVGSDVMLEIWDRFNTEGIEFPFPQRVVSFTEGAPLVIKK